MGSIIHQPDRRCSEVILQRVGVVIEVWSLFRIGRVRR